MGGSLKNNKPSNEELQKRVNKWMEDIEVENIVNPPYEEKTLELLRMPPTPLDAYMFFQFMRDNIELELSAVDSMSGISIMRLRESKASVKSLMEAEGYSWRHYKGFIERFEKDLMQDNYDRREKERNKK